MADFLVDLNDVSDCPFRHELNEDECCVLTMQRCRAYIDVWHNPADAPSDCPLRKGPVAVRAEKEVL